MRVNWSIAVLLVILLAATAVTAADKTGSVRGTVRFTAEAPKARQVPTGDGGYIDHTDLVVDPKTKGLRWVIVALEDAPARPKLKATDAPAVIDQVNMQFTPRIVAVQHGRPVQFDNSDVCNHSVRTVADRKENDLNVYVATSKPVTKSFEAEKSPIQVMCTLHGWMTAWVYVAPHPWVAVTDEKGAFALRDVPPGKYTLLLRHPDTGTLERRQVEVGAGAATEVAVEWKEVGPKRAPK